MAFWDDKQKARLVDLWNSGLSATDIAHRLGNPKLTRNSIVAQVWRMRRKGTVLRGMPTSHDRILIREKQRLYKRNGKSPAMVPKKMREKTRLQLAMEAVPFSATPDATAPKVCHVSHLEPHHCRWPIGDVGDPGFGFCGQDQFMGMPYCSWHASIAYTHPQERRYRQHVIEAPPQEENVELETA